MLRLCVREKVLPVFEMTDDPEALTQFVFTEEEGVDEGLRWYQAAVAAAPANLAPPAADMHSCNR